MDFSSNPIAASAATSSNYYDVFICFRGSDVKDSLATHLYHRLADQGLRAFFAKDDLLVGAEMIEDAIVSASVHIIIFSPQFAKSSRCLNELLMMFESGKTIIPIFYRVQPAELRWTGGGHGRYVHALSKLETKRTFDPPTRHKKPRNDRTTCENLRAALSRAANIKGFAVEAEAFNSQLVENAVKRLLKNVENPSDNSQLVVNAVERMLKNLNAVERVLKNLENPETGLLKPRYDTNTLEEWRSALSRAADLKGFVVEDEECNSDHSQLVDNVVKVVLEKLRKTPLHGSKYPIGLDTKVEELETVMLMPQQSGQTRVVGIVGLGGVGKTTLAKEIFIRHRSKYHRFCFLADVREKTARESLSSLQSTLGTELTGSEVKIDNTDKGIEELRKCVSSCRCQAIIIVDDVDHIHQLNALILPVKDVLSSNSLIFVTSRNRDVLTSFGIVETSIYELQGLKPQHSRELFCRHAFGQPYPVVGFEQVVEEFLKACGGLPLSLLVIAGFLCGNYNLEYWKQKLDEISKISPEDIQSRLKISYDGLDPEEKQIFLDIACFFTVGRGYIEENTGIRPDKETAIRIWEGSGWNGRLGPKKLQDRFLVELYTSEYTENTEYLRMHDHVRDLGRALAAKELLGGHRLWQPTENLLHNLSDQPAVRGLWCFERSHLGDNCMSTLDLLVTRGDSVKEILRKVQSPESLIYLHCDDFPYAFLPRWIPTRRLRVLSVNGFKLGRLWKESHFETPLQLRQLELRAPLLKFPKSIGQLRYLEKIVVRPPYGLPSVPLKTLPDEFCHLQRLQHLDLENFSELKGLPKSFGNLKNLQHLGLRYCSQLETLPESFGNLENLQHLDLRDCSELETLPESFGNIKNLRHLDLRYCSELETLPESFGNLKNLQHLELRYCSELETLPESFGNLKNLQHLDLRYCSKLEPLPESFGNLKKLQHLDLRYCSELETLPESFGNLKNLQNLDLSYCSELETLPESFGNLQNLRHLDLRYCSELETLPESFGNLKNLQHLESRKCGKLRTLPNSFGNLIQLEHLMLDECTSLSMSSEILGNITTLRSIDLSGCTQIEMFPGFYWEDDSGGNFAY